MNPPPSQAMTADPSVVAAAVPLLLSKLYTRIYIHQAPVPVEESCRIRNSYIQKTYQNRNVTHHKRTQTRPHEEIRLK